MSEAQLLHDILAAWGAHSRVRLSRQNVGRAQMHGGRWVQFGVPGTPDIVGVLAPWGRLLGIECKTAVGCQRDEQRTMQRVLESMGAIYVLARSVDDVDRALGALGLTR